MSKDSILDYSTTASENQDINSISTLGTSKPNVIDDIVRAQMSHIAKGLVTRRAAKDTSYTVVKADHNQLIAFTAEATCTTQSAATLTSGWECYIYAEGGAVTINPNGSETVNGEEFIVLSEGTLGVLRVYNENFLFNGFTTGSSGNACFCAAKATSQSLATAVVLAFASELVDIGDYYDTATSRWTPPAGTYRVTLSCQFTTSTAPSGTQEVSGSPYDFIVTTSQGLPAKIAIRKNGTVVSSARTEVWANTSSLGHITTSVILEMNGTDYVDAYGVGPSVTLEATTDGWAGASLFSGEAI